MLAKMKLKHKVLGLIVFLGLLPVLSAAFTYVSLRNQATAERLAMQTKAGQTYLERINGLVYAIVMDSRGIYMSSDWESAKSYAEGIARHSKELDQVAKRRVVVGASHVGSVPPIERLDRANDPDRPLCGEAHPHFHIA